MEFAHRTGLHEEGIAVRRAARGTARRRHDRCLPQPVPQQPQGEGALVTVLVARDMIPKGTSGNVLATRGLYTATTIRETSSARARSAILRASADGRDPEVFEGAQLTSADFVAAGDSLAATLTDRERVVSVPLDAAHGLIGEIDDGNRVDVYAGFNVIPVDSAGRPVNGGQARPMLRLIMSDVPVLAVGDEPDDRVGLDERHAGRRRREGGSTRVRVRQRKALARAQAERGAAASRPGLVTVETMLLGVSPVKVLRSVGGSR